MGDEENRKLFVGGTRNADENLLQTYFQNYGEIESVKVIYDRETNRYVKWDSFIICLNQFFIGKESDVTRPLTKVKSS